MTESDFDFEEWAKLALSDPEAFEARRKELIEREIAQAPQTRRKRLRCLQWRIDQVRRTTGTPVGACVRISRMMWESVLGPNGLLESLERLGQLEAQGKNDAPPVKSAKILPFFPAGQGPN